MLNLFLKHTSASLTINESWDGDVKRDMEASLNRMAPDSAKYYKHTLEGPDDMSGHVKTTLVGVSHTIPITDGKLNMGTWQGVWLCEHRNSASSRKVVLTINGVAVGK